MSKNTFSHRVVCVSVLLTLMLALTASATALAQTSAEDGQYPSPVSSDEKAIDAALSSSGSSEAGTSGSSGTAGVSVLPSTGGTLVPLVALGVLTASGIALLANRRLGR